MVQMFSGEHPAPACNKLCQRSRLRSRQSTLAVHVNRCSPPVLSCATAAGRLTRALLPAGHRNERTVKGVSFFGPGDRYIVSGSGVLDTCAAAAVDQACSSTGLCLPTKSVLCSLLTSLCPDT